jgi:hypothetical protein
MLVNIDTNFQCYDFFLCLQIGLEEDQALAYLTQCRGQRAMFDNIDTYFQCPNFFSLSLKLETFLHACTFELVFY